MLLTIMGLDWRFQELQTDLGTEVLAGVTTFMTMAYILAVNPGILSGAIFWRSQGDLFGELVFAHSVSGPGGQKKVLSRASAQKKARSTLL